MIRALYTGTSGMRVQQHKIDSIGNNIANTQTIGYKRSRPDFKEALYDVIENRPAEAGPSPRVGNGPWWAPSKSILPRVPCIPPT